MQRVHVLPTNTGVLTLSSISEKGGTCTVPTHDTGTGSKGNSGEHCLVSHTRGSLSSSLLTKTSWEAMLIVH